VLTIRDVPDSGGGYGKLVVDQKTNDSMYPSATCESQTWIKLLENNEW